MSVLLSLDYLIEGIEGVSFAVVPTTEWKRAKKVLEKISYVIPISGEHNVEEILGYDLPERIEVSEDPKVIDAFYTLFDSESYWVGIDYLGYIFEEVDRVPVDERSKRMEKSREAIPFARKSLQNSLSAIKWRNEKDKEFQKTKFEGQQVQGSPPRRAPSPPRRAPSPPRRAPSPPSPQRSSPYRGRSPPSPRRAPSVKYSPPRRSSPSRRVSPPRSSPSEVSKSLDLDGKDLGSLSDEVLQLAAQKKIGKDIKLDRQDSLAIIETDQDINFRWAVNNNIVPLVKYLAPFQDEETIKKSIYEDISDSIEILRYLLSLVKVNEEDIFKIFIRGNSDLNILTFFLEERKMPLFEGILSFALREGYEDYKYELIDFLLDQGVDPNKEKENVLKIATQIGDVNILKLLISRGANLEKLGQEALAKAVSLKNTEIVEYLLSLNVLPTKHMVESSQDEEIRNLLLDKFPLQGSSSSESAPSKVRRSRSYRTPPSSPPSSPPPVFTPGSLRVPPPGYTNKETQRVRSPTRE